MTTERSTERLLQRWLVDGVDEMPERVYLSILDRVERQPQRRAWRVPWTDSIVNPYLKPWLAAAAIFVVVVAVFVLLRPSSPAVGPPSSVETPGLLPAVSASPTAAPSSSVGVAGACELMTTDEAANALGISSPVAAVPLLHPNMEAVAPPTFPSVFCAFNTGNRSLFVLRNEEGTGADAFAIWRNQPGVEAVSGLGDGAAWAPAKGMLYILKGDRLVTIMPLEGADPTLTLEAATAIGEIVATRM